MPAGCDSRSASVIPPSNWAQLVFRLAVGSLINFIGCLSELSVRRRVGAVCFELRALL